MTQIVVAAITVVVRSHVMSWKIIYSIENNTRLKESGCGSKIWNLAVLKIRMHLQHTKDSHKINDQSYSISMFKAI